MSANATNVTNHEASSDKVGQELNAQRFQMLEDIALELAGVIVFPTYVDAAFRLRKELQNRELPLQRIAKMVSLEPLVAAKLMQLAGSVLYSPDGTPARDLTAAIKRLGVELVRTTALAIAMSQLLRSKEIAVFSEFTHTLWNHSLKTAAAARVLAQKLTPINPDEAMLAGLVHDLGAFYMIYRAAQYLELRIRPDSVKHIILQWHESIGVTLLGSLGMPEVIINASTDHDQPRELPDALKTLDDVVYVGNILAGGHFIWSGQEAGGKGSSTSADNQIYAEFLPEIEANFKEIQAVFV